MRGSTGIAIVLLVLLLSGCASNRDARPAATTTIASSAKAIPTLPPLTQPSPPPNRSPTAAPISTPDSLRTAPSQLDSDVAIPRESLENLGLVPSASGVDIFFELARDHYGGAALFDNYWELPVGASGHIVDVRDYRYAFPSSYLAESFLLNASHGLIQAAEGAGNQVTEHFVYLGDAAFVAVFTKPGQQVYAAQFAVGQTAGIVIVAGDEELAQDEAFGLFSLAAQRVGARTLSLGTPIASAKAPTTVIGNWWGQHRSVAINPDGSGTMSLNQGCCTGVTYYLRVEFHGSFLSATIVGRAFVGEPELTNAARVGEALTLRLEPQQGVDVLMVTMPSSEQNFVQHIEVCRSGTDPPCAT